MFSIKLVNYGRIVKGRDTKKCKVLLNAVSPLETQNKQLQTSTGSSKMPKVIANFSADPIAANQLRFLL